MQWTFTGTLPCPYWLWCVAYETVFQVWDRSQRVRPCKAKRQAGNPGRQGRMIGPGQYSVAEPDSFMVLQ